MPDINNKPIITVKNLSRNFGGTHALKNVSLDFFDGEIHALAGENGAGKSTLCKILSGAIIPSSGTVNLFGADFSRLTPHLSKANGIAMIYQEFNLVPDLTVADNIFLGSEPRQGPFVDNRKMIQETRELFREMEVNIDPLVTISEISVAYCQLVEIAKVLKENAKVIIMDEPTAPLTTQETEVLFGLIKKLKAKGITILYISHRMEEIMELADRVTVMRDGEVIKTMNVKDSSVNEIISLMVGRELGMNFPPKGDTAGEVVLSVQNLCTNKIKNVSFELRKGEILGLAGLVGAGRTEVVRAIFGADKLTAGRIILNSRPVKIKSPADAIKHNMGLIPEDRKRQGIHLDLPIRFNMSLIRIKELSRIFTVRKGKENRLLDDFIKTLSIKMASSEHQASSLSGGNQQKVVLTKWLATHADILFFDEPTRGIDVGAKAEIYELMADLRKKNKAIIMISSEMQEIIGMCDRILVMYEGVIMGELGKDVSQPQIMELASGMKRE